MEKISNPTYSILIPHLNGWNYIFPNLSRLLESNREDFEVVISDNLSGDSQALTNELLIDSRVKLVSPNQRLSMRENYEFALSNAVGKWILLLGADDGILDDVFVQMDQLVNQYPNAEIFNWRRAYYFWPGVEDIYGSLRLSYVSQNNVIKKNSSTAFLMALLGLYPLFDLPQIYTCTFVKKELVAKLRSPRNNLVYPPCIPDLYSSVAILKNTDNYVRLLHPLSLVGSSATSLGIGNRIYEDGINNSSTETNLLHLSTVKAIHSGKFNSYYILDAYRSYCEFKEEKPSSLMIAAGIIGTLGEILEKKSLIQYIPNFRTKYGSFKVCTLGPALILMGVMILGIKSILKYIKKATRWLDLKFRANSWKVHLDSSSALETIDLAIEAVSKEQSARNLR